MKEWEVWKGRDSALTALVKDNKDYISQLKEALESSRKDVQVDVTLKSDLTSLEKSSGC